MTIKRDAYDNLTNAIRAGIRQAESARLGFATSDPPRARRAEEYRDDLQSLLRRVINDRETLPQ